MIGDALWELAGPRLFAAEVERALIERLNVFAHSSDARTLPVLASGLRLTLGVKQHYLQEVQLDSWEGDWKTLRQYFEAPGETLEDYCANLGAMSFLLLARTGIAVSRLKELLDRWQHATRMLPKDSRPVLVLVGFCPSIEKAKVKGDVALRPIDWDGFLSLSDIEAFAWPRLKLSGRANHSVLRRMLARVVAEVSQGDADLAVFLCECRCDEIANPEIVVRRWFDRQRAETVPAEILVEGEWREHSAHALRSGRAKETIGERVWRAQAAELLPWVEVQRARLVGGLSNRLKLVDGQGNPVGNVRELEVGEVWFQLKEQGRHDQALTVFDRLREIRNKAAHGEVTSFARLVDTLDLLAGIRSL
jgi:hypothetical protein